jgi:hypothetical protein
MPLFCTGMGVAAPPPPDILSSAGLDPRPNGFIWDNRERRAGLKDREGVGE